MEELVARRVRRLQKLRESGARPFRSTRFERTAFSDELVKKHSKLKPGSASRSKAAVAGRLMSIRVHGGVAFATLADARGTLQLFFRRDFASEPFTFLEDYLDEGDIAGASGTVVKTKRGEVSVKVRRIELLAKALRPLPSEWYGLKDVETRYRQRYLDLAMNPSVRRDFECISRMVNGMRSHLLAREFTEVDTPILQPIYGGAFARPFRTHHNYLKQDMFLRVAPELYLKRLVVGGMERVFEIGQCFRNESVDSTHNPEFVQLEAYQAFTDYEGMMELFEATVAAGVKAAVGSTKVKFQGKAIDFKVPWKRTTLEGSLKSKGIDVAAMTDNDLVAAAKELGAKAPRVGDAIEALFGHHVQAGLLQPTFVTHFPADISPLAKRFPDNPRMAQRFEAYAAGMELGNAYSELNDPVEQFERFRGEQQLRQRHVDEFMPMDRDYVRALEYGMPPTGGLGIGIARVASIVLDKPSIKEVLLFPAMSGTERIKNVTERFPELKGNSGK